MLNTTNGSASLTSGDINWKATPTITQTSIFFILAFITVVGNGLVIIAVVMDPLKELRTIPNYLVVNLAIADFLLGLIAEPLWGMALWINSKRYHAVAMSVILISTNTTAFTVLAMSVERYVVLKAGLEYQSVITQKRLAACIVAIWLISVVTSLLPMMGWNHLPSYLLFLSDGIHIPAFVITIIMYVLIFRILNNSRINCSSVNSQAAINARLRQKQVAKTIFIVLVVYAFCWIPAWVSGNIAFTCGSKCITQKVNNFINLLGLINSFTNPIIYAFKMPRFRAAVLLLLRCRGSRSQHTINRLQTKR